MLTAFTLTLVKKTNNILLSTAAVTDVTFSLNDIILYCLDGGKKYEKISLAVRNITSVGPPIGLSVTAHNDSSVDLTWSPPSLDSIHCITGYIISRDDIPVRMTNTSTNTLVLSYAAVDKINTTGSYSQHVIINLSVSLVDVVSPTPPSSDTTDAISTIDSTSSTPASSNDATPPKISSSPADTLSTTDTSTSSLIIPSTSISTNNITLAVGASIGEVLVIVVIVMILLLIIPVIILKKKKTNKSVQFYTPQQDYIMETFTSPNSPPSPPPPSPSQSNQRSLYMIKSIGLEEADTSRDTDIIYRLIETHIIITDDAESTGQYSLISSSADDENSHPLPPPYNPMEIGINEYSKLRREDKEKQRIDDMRGTNMGGPLYSTMNQEKVEPAVIPAKPKGLVYTEVGNFTGRRANVLSQLESVCIYSQVQLTPQIPKRSSSMRKTEQIL